MGSFQANMDDKKFLQKAIEKARESVSLGGFPARAVIVKNGKIVGEGVSIGNKLNDPTSHGEMASIQEACKTLKTSDLSQTALYASMQPCVMCLGAAMWSLIPKIVYACPKEKVSVDYYGGQYKPSAINSELTHPIEIVHFVELEKESLTVVMGWEKSLVVRG